jgi:hypothetical protein
LDDSALESARDARRKKLCELQVRRGSRCPTRVVRLARAIAIATHHPVAPPSLVSPQQYVLAAIVISSVFYVIFASAWHMATSDRPPAYKPRPYLGFGGN